MPKVFAELNEAGTRIEVRFAFSQLLVNKAKSVPGRKFIPHDKGGPAWEYPLDVATGRRLRKAFGEELELGQALRVWGQRAVAQEKELVELANADTAELDVLPERLPDLHKYLCNRPYQLADVKFMVAAKNPLNANAPSLGKTFETIASIFEGGMDTGPQLVFAPVTALETVWFDALAEWQDQPVLLAPFSAHGAGLVYREAYRLADLGKPFWLITNPYAAMLDIVKETNAETGERGSVIKGVKAPVLGEIEWKTVIVDEFHKCGLGNKDSLTRRGLATLKAERRVALSGTPIGGKAKKLWSVLNWLEPNVFTSYWRWVDQWLVVNDNGYGKQVEDIRHGLEQEFSKAHARYMVRRTKEEVRKELRSKADITQNVWAHMGPEQKDVYDKFSRDAELRIEEERLNAIGILAEYTRLRQFAIAKPDLKFKGSRGMVVVPTDTSCKLDQLLRILGEHGITGDDEDEGGEQAVVFSQFNEVVEWLERVLTKKGIQVDTLTGNTPQPKRVALQRSFEARQGPRVLLMNTMAGGVAITLNQSNLVVFMDETWNPDDQEQAEDRNRNNSADIYYIRTRESIEEQIIQPTNIDKRRINDLVLDLHRRRSQELA